MNAEGKRELLDFLSSHTTLVLSTVGREGHPAAAALFYAEDDALNLYFISEAESEHSRNILHRSKVALAIAADGQDWKQLTGVQIKGACARLTGSDRDRAQQRYVSKFQFVMRSSMLAERIDQSDFCAIQPEWIRLTDNRLGFSNKREWVLTL